MLEDDIGMPYDDFVKQYVKETCIDWSISFKYKDKIYQFCYWENGPTDIAGATPYDFLVFDDQWNLESAFQYTNLNEAIEKASVGGASFREVYSSEDSELIDIS